MAERLIEIYDHLKKYIDSVAAGPTAKKPKCTSFGTVVKFLSSETTLAKLHVFVRVAKFFLPFLEKFQMTAPMLPFVDQELKKIIRCLLEQFVKTSKLGTSSSLIEMLALDLDNEDNLIKCDIIGIGVAAKQELNKLKLSTASSRQFRSECRACYKSIVSKIRDRVPAETQNLFTNLSSLNPKFIFDHPSKTIIRFENLLMFMIDKKLVLSTKGDVVLSQYRSLSAKVRSERRHEAAAFSPSSTRRLDTFFNELIGTDSDFSGLYFFCSGYS